MGRKRKPLVEFLSDTTRAELQDALRLNRMILVFLDKSPVYAKVMGIKRVRRHTPDQYGKTVYRVKMHFPGGMDELFVTFGS